jgi:hypothetical protein
MNKYTETYAVNYTYKATDGYWKQGEEIIKGKNKNSHKAVEKEFKNWCKQNNIKDYTIFSIVYQ